MATTPGAVGGVAIMLVDDHAVVRAALSLLLETQSDFEVVGTAGDAEEAIGGAEKLAPDLILLDITMPGRSGLDALPEILAASPNARALILTMHDDQAYLGRALELGASGYLLKTAEPGELFEAVRTVHGGRSFISITLGDDSLRGVVEDDGDYSGKYRANYSSSGAELSDRELEVLGLIGCGDTNREIAEKTSLSAKSVETYRTRFAQKLGIRKRAELIRYAVEHGLLGSPG